jgi:hypothetical protein
MAKVEAAAAPSTAKALVRDPVAMGSAVLTVVGTVLYVLPAFGVKLPPAVQKATGLVFTLASALGLKMSVKPI